MRLISERLVFRGVVAAASVWLAIVLAPVARPTIGQDNQDKQAKGEPGVAKRAKEFRGRLPNYYRYVVDEKQRQAIYAIQAAYAPKIAEVKQRLEALYAERDEKVAAVLTPEQRKMVEQLRAAARAKREAKKAKENKAAAEQQPDD